MPDLSPLCATGGSAPAEARHGVLSIRENPELALASVARRQGAPEPSPLGLSLPGPGGWTAAGDTSAFWTGPDQWMIEGHGLADSDFAARVVADCPDASVTEQTDGFVAFEIHSAKGERPIIELLAKLVNLDPLRIQVGNAGRTGLEHLAVFVIRRAPDRLAVIGMRSAAGSLWHALETAISRQVEVAA